MLDTNLFHYYLLLHFRAVTPVTSVSDTRQRSINVMDFTQACTTRGGKVPGLAGQRNEDLPMIGRPQHRFYVRSHTTQERNSAFSSTGSWISDRIPGRRLTGWDNSLFSDSILRRAVLVAVDLETIAIEAATEGIFIEHARRCQTRRER